MYRGHLEGSVSKAYRSFRAIKFSAQADDLSFSFLTFLNLSISTGSLPPYAPMGNDLFGFIM